MTQEWMPTNPCEGCENLDEKLCAGKVRWCKRYADFKDDVTAQTKLLDYLKDNMGWLPPQTIKIRPTKTNTVTSLMKTKADFRVIPQSSLESMRKQLEEQK